MGWWECPASVSSWLSAVCTQPNRAHPTLFSYYLSSFLFFLLPFASSILRTKFFFSSFNDGSMVAHLAYVYMCMCDRHASVYYVCMCGYSVSVFSVSYMSVGCLLLLLVECIMCKSTKNKTVVVWEFIIFLQHQMIRARSKLDEIYLFCFSFSPLPTQGAERAISIRMLLLLVGWCCCC